MKPEDDQARVAPLTAGAAPAGSTAAGNAVQSSPFTPGPWRVEKPTWGAVSVEYVLADRVGAFGSVWPREIAVLYDDDGREANARLIAAAPDQHAALKAVRDEIRRRCSQHALDIVDAAIAKAEEGR